MACTSPAAAAPASLLGLQSIRVHSPSNLDEADITHVRVGLRDENDAEGEGAAAASLNEEQTHPPPSSARRHRPSHSGGGGGGGGGGDRMRHTNDDAAVEDRSSISILLPASARAASSSVAAAPVAPAPSQLLAPSPPPSVPAPAAAAPVNSHVMLQSFPAFFSLSLAAPDISLGQSEPGQLAALPADCLFCVLLHLDGATLAALSRCCTSLCSLVEGEDSAAVWRGVARADVARLFSHERAALAFAEPQTPAGEDEEGVPLAPPSVRRAQQQQQALDPRTQYMLRLKQRRMTLQGASLEAQRLRAKVAQSRQADSTYVRTQLAIESAFLLAFPTMMLASSILLLVSAALPRRHVAWIVLLPLWALLLGLPLLGLGMHRLRLKFLARKRQERADAAAAPPTVGATPSTSTRERQQQQQQQQQQNQLQLPQGSAGAAAAVPASPSSSSAANTAAARARSRAAAEAALQRERRNNRFLAGAARAAEARGINTGRSATGAGASAAASSALIAQAHDGLLARLLDSHFDTRAHGLVNACRIGLLAASTVLLAIKLSAAAAADLPYVVVFAPLYALGLHALVHPLLPAFCAPSDLSSRAEFAGSTAAFARRHALHCVQWTLAPLLTLVLLGLHLDSPSGSVSQLAYALAPLWAWQCAAFLVLLSWVMRFGAGVTGGFEIVPATSTSLSPASVSVSSALSPSSVQMVQQHPASLPPGPQPAPMIAALPPPALVMEDGSGAMAAGAAPSAAPSCWSRFFAFCCAPLLRLRFRARRQRDLTNARLALTLVSVLLVLVCVALFEGLLCVESIASLALRTIPLVVAWTIGTVLCVASVLRMRSQLSEAEYARLQADVQSRLVRV